MDDSVTKKHQDERLHEEEVVGHADESDTTPETVLVKAPETEKEVILKVGGEGGTITLWGRKTREETWQFGVGRDESALYDFLDEEDEVLLVSRPLNWVNTWQEALNSLSSYPWHRLSPREVHPEFQRAVWNEVQSKMTEIDDWRVERWREVCRRED